MNWAYEPTRLAEQVGSIPCTYFHLPQPGKKEEITVQTLTRPRAPRRAYSGFQPPRSRRRRFSPLMLIGMTVTLLVILGAGAFVYIQQRLNSHAANPNPNCSLQVPNQPLTAQGLATPYQLSATDPAQGPCNEANANQSAFVQAVIFDPATNALSAYEPLVVDQGTQPAITPVAPQLPQGAVVALWFGFNGTFLHLTGDKAGGLCVNGRHGSDFGQFAYCNAPQFFHAVNAAISAGKLTVPPLGTASDGQPCPTTRSFAIVDMDQSDNVQTRYLTNGDGHTAQFSAANMNQLQNATTLANPSDNALVSRFVDPALGCQPWMIPDLVDNGVMTPTLATDEMQAAADQQPPVALVPSGDEMVLVNNKPSLSKVNAYRIGVDQTPAATANDASTTSYCTNLINIALPRLQLDTNVFQNKPSPDGGATANSLFTFLASRLNATLGANGLNCVGLLNIQNPVKLITNDNGVVTGATLTISGTGTGTGGSAPDCKVNGTVIAGCTGTVTITGQTCTLAFAGGTVTETCTGNNNGNPGPGTPVALPFNNSGISNDTNVLQGNFDGVGFSYSAQTLQNAGLTPGKTLNFNGVSFLWPKAAVGTPNNVVAQGQVIPVTAGQGATMLAFLGSAAFGPSTGKATITYTDGTTQTFTLAFSDWTLNGGGSTPLNADQVVVALPYRNGVHGRQLDQMPEVFFTSVALQPGKTIKSVTLPTGTNQGQIHIFAMSTK